MQQRYTLNAKGKVLVQGRAIGQKIGAGPVRIVSSAAEMDRVQKGDVLVTDMTDPNWEPVMKRARLSLLTAAVVLATLLLLPVSSVSRP